MKEQQRKTKQHFEKVFFLHSIDPCAQWKKLMQTRI